MRRSWLRSGRVRDRFQRLQAAPRVALLAQVLQPFAEEHVHPHAVVDDRGEWRMQPEYVLPLPTEVAMGHLGLLRVAVMPDVGRWIGLAGQSVMKLGVGQSQLDRVRMAIDDV